MDDYRVRPSSILVPFGPRYGQNIYQPLTERCENATKLFAIVKAQRDDVIKSLVNDAHHFMSNLWKYAKNGRK